MNTTTQGCAPARHRASDTAVCARRAWLALCAATALVGSAGVFAQPANQGFKSCSSVAGAKCTPQPGPETPVAAQYRDSYAAYMQMKEKAHGGTAYTRADYAKMPDWSGNWTRGGGGLKFDPAQPGALSEGHTTAVLTPKYEAAYREKLRQVASSCTRPLP